MFQEHLQLRPGLTKQCKQPPPLLITLLTSAPPNSPSSSPSSDISNCFHSCADLARGRPCCDNITKWYPRRWTIPTWWCMASLFSSAEFKSCNALSVMSCASKSSTWSLVVMTEKCRIDRASHFQFVIVKVLLFVYILFSHQTHTQLFDMHVKQKSFFQHNIWSCQKQLIILWSCFRGRDQHLRDIWRGRCWRSVVGETAWKQTLHINATHQVTRRQNLSTCPTINSSHNQLIP